MLRVTIQEQLKAAMKARDTVKLEALRFVWSEIKNREIDKHAELTDEEVIQLLQKEVKNREEAIGQFKQAGRDDLVQSEEAKLTVIKAFLPEQMGRAELEGVVQAVIDAGVTDFGQVMREVMGKVKGKVDGKLVADVVRQKIEG